MVRKNNKLISVNSLIEQILRGDDLIETHPQFNLQVRLTRKGREMMNFDYFSLWEQSSFSNTPTPLVWNDYSNNKGTILKDVSNSGEIAAEGSTIDKSFKVMKKIKKQKT